MGLHALYDWVVLQAQKPYAAALLFFVALLEPCLLPLPPDILLIPMAIARRERAFGLALLCTLGSVLGGLIGYGIGAMAMATIGKLVIATYSLQGAFDHFNYAFNKYGMWIILAKGLTPIPFILVAIASGVAHLNLGIFVVSATITRGARFLLEAVLIHYFGAPIETFIRRYLPWVALAVLAAFLLGFWVVLR